MSKTIDGQPCSCSCRPAAVTTRSRCSRTAAELTRFRSWPARLGSSALLVGPDSRSASAMSRSTGESSSSRKSSGRPSRPVSAYRTGSSSSETKDARPPRCFPAQTSLRPGSSSFQPQMSATSGAKSRSTTGLPVTASQSEGSTRSSVGKSAARPTRSTHAAAPRIEAMGRLAREDELLGVVDHLARLGRDEHHLDDLLDVGLAARPDALHRRVDVVFRAAQLDIRAEERPVRAPPALVGEADAARVQAPDPGYLAVELDVDVRGHDHPLVDLGAELAHPLVGRLGRDALLVAARRAVAKANRPQPVNLDDDVLLEAPEELAHLVRVVPLHPLFALGLRDALENGSIGVPAHEPGFQAARQLVRLLGQRPPRQAAAGADPDRLPPRE